MRLEAHPQMLNAARQIAAGAVVAYPTEGVWGLGCEPGNRHAVAHILQLKKRPQAKGLILVAAHIKQLDFLLHDLDPPSYQTLQATWPGPVTWLIPHRDRVPEWICGRFDSVAVRVSAHASVQALCRLVGGPIVSTSANPQSKLPARYGFQVRRYFGPELVLAPGQVQRNGRPSQIRDLRTGKVLRA